VTDWHKVHAGARGLVRDNARGELFSEIECQGRGGLTKGLRVAITE
jgi:hypothetical protein